MGVEVLKDKFNIAPAIDDSIIRLVKKALHMSVASPVQFKFFFSLLGKQRKAAAKRAHWAEQGVQVPSFMIASITNRCNLNCKGCYNHELHAIAQKELEIEKLGEIINEAADLGVSFMLTAGGEPLTRPEILDIAGKASNIVFPLFTNGLLMDDAVIEKLVKYRNIIPIISLEGLAGDTDRRRGDGVYARVEECMSKLKEKGIFFGTSLTVTRENYLIVTNDEFIRRLVNRGCKLFFYVDYVPVKEGTEELSPDEEQRLEIVSIVKHMQERFAALFLAFPGNEELFGGCISAGRGFVHISPEGNLEPCPFAPYSDVNLNNMPLKEALKSEFLKTIREHYEELGETTGGCALWNKREWVKSLLN